MTTELLTHTQGKTLVMTLSGAAHRNVLSPQVYAAGVEALNMAESSPDVQAVVITGAAGHFCAGGDLQRLHHNRQHDLPAQRAAVQSFHDWIVAMRTFPKPVLAAVEGHAAGAGVSLALACDLIVASSEARFGLSHIRAGLSPDGGLTWALTHALGRQRAWAALALGETHEAGSWAAAGLVHSLCEPGQALASALALADQLAQQAPCALSSLKELLNQAEAGLSAQLDSELSHFMHTLQQGDAGAAIDSFLARRRRQ